MSNWRTWRTNCQIGGRPPEWRTVVLYATEHIKAYAKYRALELLENQFTLLTIYLVEIASIKLRKKNAI